MFIIRDLETFHHPLSACLHSNLAFPQNTHTYISQELLTMLNFSLFPKPALRCVLFGLLHVLVPPPRASFPRSSFPHLLIICLIPSHPSGFLLDITSSEKPFQAPLDWPTYFLTLPQHLGLPWSQDLLPCIVIAFFVFPLFCFLNNSLNHALCQDRGWTCLFTFTSLLPNQKRCESISSFVNDYSTVLYLSVSLPQGSTSWPDSLTQGGLWPAFRLSPKLDLCKRPMALIGSTLRRDSVT